MVRKRLNEEMFERSDEFGPGIARMRLSMPSCLSGCLFTLRVSVGDLRIPTPSRSGRCIIVPVL